ncbi:MAG: hypothetical protein PWP70_222 [Moorella sp. (in: firmicutes)]|nr:hypothetical protein [Moorella sp. (in: firmicutes)]
MVATYSNRCGVDGYRRNLYPQPLTTACISYYSAPVYFFLPGRGRENTPARSPARCLMASRSVV